MSQAAKHVCDEAMEQLRAVERHLAVLRKDCGQIAYWGKGPSDLDRDACRVVEAGCYSMLSTLRQWESLLAGVAVSLSKEQESPK